MIIFTKHIFRFVLFVLVQTLIFNQFEIGFGIQFMIYPLFIFLLPHDLNIFILFIVSFVFGFSIDVFSNTYGLHASASLIVAIFRKPIYTLFKPRDDYDIQMELSYHNMEFQWILFVQGSLILIHHFWFFLLEIFKFNELLFLFASLFNFYL